MRAPLATTACAARLARALAPAVLVLALSATPLAAAAQDDAARAAQLFRDASRAFSHDDYLEALRLFSAAHEAAPHPTVRFHVAMCLERLGRLREAWVELSEVAATAGLTEAQRRDAARQLARVREQLVTLRVEGEPAGASVSVDGTPLCALPCEVPVDPGEHEVVAEAAEGRTSTRVSGVRGATVVARLVIARAEPERGAEDASSGTGSESGSGSGTDSGSGTGTGTGTGSESGSGAGDAPRAGAGVGWLLVTGSALAALGAGGVIGFGLRASDVHAAWLDDPTAERRDEGLLFRDLTNASIAVLSLGGALVLVDILLALGGDGTGERAARDAHWRF